MFELIDWLRRLDARFVAAVTSHEPLSEKQSRVAELLGAAGLILAIAAGVLLPAHSVAQTALLSVGLLVAVPLLHGAFEKALLAARGDGSA